MSETTFLPQEKVPFNTYPKVKSSREFVHFFYSQRYEMERILTPYLTGNKINKWDLTSFGRLAPFTLRKTVYFAPRKSLSFLLSSGSLTDPVLIYTLKEKVN